MFMIAIDVTPLFTHCICKRSHNIFVGFANQFLGGSPHLVFDHLIHLQQRPVSELRHPKKYGFIITNPPYGERLEDQESLPQIYREFGESFRRLYDWSAYVITAYEEAERYFGRKADKNRKIYNGMIKTYFYQFMGPKPPRREKRDPGTA